MGNNLRLNFKRVALKNTKLKTKNCQIMKIIFLKYLPRAISMNLYIIYIDETSYCFQNNNNFKDSVSDS